MKVYSLDTYRALLNEGREAELNDIEITNQVGLDQHFKNIEIVKNVIQLVPIPSFVDDDEKILS